MHTNIASNLHANTEQVRPAPDKGNTEKYIEVMIFNFSTDLSANLAQFTTAHAKC